MIYFPMTCNILTKGHIMCLKYLSLRDDVTIGLLSSKALKGYKKEVVSFTERKYILQHISLPLYNVKVVKQDSLDPSNNIKRYKCTAMASGDGFEKVELDAILRYNIRQIDIKLKGEKSKRYSSSKILNS